MRGWRELFVLAALLASCASPPRPAARRPRAPTAVPAAVVEVPHQLQLGPIALTLSDSRTAQVFHIVDRLSRWCSMLSPAYTTWAETAMPLDDAERAMLAAHAKLRARRGWGALDQAFYVEDSIDVAAKDAADRKLLTHADAEAERALLDHFAPRLDALLVAQKPAVTALEEALAREAPAVGPLAAQLGRFCETEGTVEVHAFLVSDPSKSAGGGSAHGGRLVVEVMPDADGVPTFLHALFHEVLERRRGSIAIAAQKCDEPVDPETLQEGLAYAFAPGLVHRRGADPLLDMVNADRARPLSDPDVRFARLGLAIRTELGSALEGGRDSLGAFLPTVCDAWGKLVKR